MNIELVRVNCAASYKQEYPFVSNQPKDKPYRYSRNRLPHTLSAYENIHKLKKEEAFKSWIFTILTNKCKKRLKKALKETPGREEELPEQATAPDYDLAIDVKKAFFVLSEEEQILVGLSVFGGYCSQEIGEMMRLNPNTVRSKRSRALKKMECVLGSYGEDEKERRE